MQVVNKITVKIVMLLAILLLSACGGGSTAPDAPKIVEITISTEKTNISKDASLQLSIDVEYEDGSTENITDNITWSSNNLDIANISAEGLLSSAGIDGSVDITATFDGVTQVITFVISNAAPSISSSAIVVATSELEYTYDVDATDDNAADTLSYTLETFPSGMVIDGSTGLINWTPSSEQVGEHSVNVKVTDNSSTPLSVEQAFTITVAASNIPPAFTSTPITTARAGIIYVYDVDASDANTLTYSLVSTVVGMSIDSTTGKISWSPAESQVGMHDITVNATDDGLGFLSETQNFKILVTKNLQPTINSTAIENATQLKLYSYEVKASDDNAEDALVFTLEKFPAGMEINPTTGLINWTPNASQLQSHLVEIKVTDDGAPIALSVTQSFLLTVIAQNAAPTINSPAITEAHVGSTYEYPVIALDGNATDTLVYTLIASPAEMKISTNGLISWAPTPSQIGSFTVKVQVTDGELIDDQEFTLVVVAQNLPPKIDSTPNTTANEALTYSYDVNASDENLDTLTYDLVEFPLGMSIHPTTGEITWMPGTVQVGTHTIIVKVSDNGFGELFATQTFTITVAERNVEPNFTSTDETIAYAGVTYLYEARATDENENDTLTYALTISPEGMSINPTTGDISWTPDDTLFGNFAVTMTVMDDGFGLLSDSRSFTITVTKKNIKPVFISTEITQAYAGVAYLYEARATDENNIDALTFSLTSSPEEMSINKTTGDINWTPNSGLVGNFEVIVTVTDNGKPELSDIQSYTINLAALNEAPIFITKPTILNANPRAEFSYDFDATDNNAGDVLEFSLVTEIVGMSIDASSGVITWTPTVEQIGTSTVNIEVTDKGTPPLKDSFEFSIEVTEDNIAPEFTTTPSATAQPGIEYVYTFAVSDPNTDDTHSFEVTLPDEMGMTYDSANSTLVWTPANEQLNASPFSVTITATDSGLPAESATQSFTIDVLDLSAPEIPQNVVAQSVNVGQINVSWDASVDVAGGETSGYEIFRDGDVTPIATVLNTTNYSDKGLSSATAYSYTVLAFDNATPINKSLASAPANATTLTAINMRINAGGNQYTDTAGNVWSNDTGFTSGTVAPVGTTPVNGTNDDELYLTERWSNPAFPELKYDFSLPNGTYTVHLHFSERFEPNFASGERVFDVKLEDRVALANLDVFSEAGGNTALIKSVPVTINDGVLSIRFVRKSKSPMINAIEISNAPFIVAPSINPNGGLLIEPALVTLSSPVTGAEIYYTLDGTLPTEASALYTEPFSIADGTQVKARTFIDSDASLVAEAGFNTVSPQQLNFSSGGLLGWVTVNDSTGASTWAVINGELTQGSERGIIFGGSPTDAPSSFDETYHLGTYAYYTGGLDLTNYRVSLEMTPTPDSSWNLIDNGHDVGVMFRYVDINNYYRLSLNSAYGFARLEKKVQGVFSTLAVDGRGYQAENQLIEVTIEVMNDLIQVYIDGEARFSAQDADILKGSVALYTQDGAKFDNVLIVQNNTSPSIVIDEPVAYSVSTGNLFVPSAVVLNVPIGGNVEFDIDGNLCSSVIEISAGYYSANCPVVNAGNHTVTAVIKDATEVLVASDINLLVGSSGSNYVTIGDSITNGIGDKYAADNKSADGKAIASQGYATMLHDMLNTSKTTPQMVFNEGISGITAGQTVSRLDSILERHIDANNALIMLGTNDSSDFSPVPSGLGCSGNECDGTFKGDMQAIIDQLNPSVTPIIAFPPPVLTAFDPKNAARNLLIEQYITVINTELTGRLIGPDFFSYFLSPNENRTNLFTDNLHPNGLAHALMAQLWHYSLTSNTNLPTRNQLRLVLEDICVRDVSSGCQYPLKYKQDFIDVNGTPYYVDETYSVITMPEMLNDSIWLRGENEDKTNIRSDYLTFTIDRNVDVYIAYDASASALPDWLLDFTNTGETLFVSDIGSPAYSLYKKSYDVGIDTPANGSISLGGNLATGATGANRNYIVIVKEQ